MKLIMKPLVIVSMIMISGAMSFTAVAQQLDNKCSPCQAAKSIRDALAKSLKDAAAAAVAAGGPFSREKELDVTINREICEKCGCARTTRDELAANITNEFEKCGCSNRTTRDELAASLDEEAADVSRAPREELVNPCDTCSPEESDASIINGQLHALGCCCKAVAQAVECQGKAAQKCCKGLRRRMNDLRDAVGDPAEWAINLPLDEPNIAALVNSTEADVIEWLKAIYILLYNLSAV